MDNTEILNDNLLEPGVIEQIKLGNWAQALLLNPTSEFQLCSQVLRAACTTDNSHDPVDSDAFGRNVSQWIDLCEETIKNSPDSVAHQHNDANVRSRLALAFAEAIWALGVEWELDTTLEGDDRWTSEQIRYAEQRRILVALARNLIACGVVSQELAKERLDPDILEQAGTVSSAAAFTKKYVRLNTALHFKQTKFNLITEQSEGFSKIVTLIQSSMAGIVPHQLSSDILAFINDTISADRPALDAHDTAVIQALRLLPDLQKRIGCLLVDIQRLIGVFNIDPNRVVDIILDCFTSNVRQYWGFYIALLDASPWCKGLAESRKVAQLIGWKFQFYIKGPESDYKYTDELSTVAALLISHGLIRLVDIYPMLEPDSDHGIQQEYEGWRAKMKEQSSNSGQSLLAMMGGLEDMDEGGEDKASLDSDGSKVESEWKNQHALLCTKLLSVGGIRDALVYLKRFPSMARVHQQIADLAVRIIDISTDKLYRATDCVKAPIEPRIRISKPVLLTPDESCQLKNPWGLPGPQDNLKHPEIQTHVNSYVLTPLLKKASEVFFYEKFWLIEGSRQLPKISAVNNIPQALAPWLNVAFLRLHQYPSILTRLIRICRYGMTTSSEKESCWLGFLRSWIIPAYSFCNPSAGMSNELWMLISALPLEKRYEMYAYWEYVLHSGKPDLPAVSSEPPTCSEADKKPNMPAMGMSLDDALGDVDMDGDLDMMQTGEQDGDTNTCDPYVEIESLCHDVRRKVRSVMRRLSGDTVRLMGRQLCSLCHSAPAIALKVVLDQVCSYDNLVDSVVEAFRYLTPLDSDVMFYVILKILADPDNNKIKDDGINAAHWLQSISSFVSAYSHRHENQGLGVILDYVLKRTIDMVCKEGAPPVFDLTIVSDTILRLASVDVMANAADDQILALQGGHYLRLEAFSMVSPWGLPQDATADMVVATGSENRLTRRLSDWLTNMFSDSGQALSFSMAMCVHAEKVLSMSTLPLSNVLVIYDREIERVYQLFHLLSSNLKPEKYIKLIPGPHVLVKKYGLSWGLAILWGRPSISMALNENLKRWEESGEHVKTVIVEQDAQEAVDEDDVPHQALDEGDESGSHANSPIDPTAEGDMPVRQDGQELPSDAKPENGDSKMDVDSEALQHSNTADKANVSRVVTDLKFEAPLLPRDYVEHIASTLPISAKEVGLSPEFVAVFWAMTLYDTEVPFGRYKKEIAIQSNLIKRIEAISKQVQSRSKSASLAQIKARAALTIDNLEKEMQEQSIHVSRIRTWLIAQKDYWFCMAHDQRKRVTHALLQHCILPRAVLSASDANFCAKFIWMMHYPLATNKFSLMIACDNIFSDTLSTLLAAFTENEARNYAKFLNTTLAYLSPLHASESCYNERAVNAWRGLTGFQQIGLYERGYLPPMSRTIRQQTPADPGTDMGDSKRIKAGSTMLSYDDFRSVMRKWHVALTKAFISTLDSKRNDTVRNGILALREMQPSFPVISQFGRRILEKVNGIATSGRSAHGKGDGMATEGLDSSKSLKAMATTYGAYLAMAKKNWISDFDYYPSASSRDSALVSPQPKRAQTNIRQEHRESPKPDQRTFTNRSGVPESTSKRDGYVSASGADSKPEKSQRGRQRPSGSRSFSNEAVAAAAVAAASTTSVSNLEGVSASRPRSPALATPTRGAAAGTGAEIASSSRAESYVPSKSNTSAPTGDKQPGSGHDQDSRRVRERDRDSDGRNRGRDRDRDRVRNRQYEADQWNSPRHVDADRRDSRSLRGSPSVQQGRNEGNLDKPPHKRQREDSMSDSKLEPPRQRMATSSNVTRQHPSSPRGHNTQGKSPSPSPLSGAGIGAASSKLSSEEVDRKRKELRAQLLKQQEEKQRQSQKQIPQHVEQRSDKNTKDSRGVSSRHSSREGSMAREPNMSFADNGRGETKENGSKKGRHGSARPLESTGSNASQQQHEQKKQSQQQQNIHSSSVEQRGKSDRGPRRQSHRDQALPSSYHPSGDKSTQADDGIAIRSSGNRQPRNDDSRGTGPAASFGRKGLNERKNSDGRNGGGSSGSRRGSRRNRGSDAHNRNDDRRYRR
ncbi:THO2 plays a role in transcriptional elongation [Coemansia sp. RSA 1646]|nr:THO2 plays a role in transcriptional elongation [Coemansia sp. RSA 1646]